MISAVVPRLRVMMTVVAVTLPVVVAMMNMTVGTLRVMMTVMVVAATAIIVRVSPVTTILPPVVSTVTLRAVVRIAIPVKIAVPLGNPGIPVILSVSLVTLALPLLQSLLFRLLAVKAVAGDMVGIAMILAMTAATGDKLTLRDQRNVRVNM